MPAGGEGSRAAGKRQVRPNMARSDFGYEERSRAPAKPIKKPKRAEDDDEPASANGADGGAARPARNEKEARNLVRGAPRRLARTTRLVPAASCHLS